MSFRPQGEIFSFTAVWKISPRFTRRNDEHPNVSDYPPNTASSSPTLWRSLPLQLMCRLT